MASDHPWLSVTLVLTLCHVLRVSVLDIIVWMVSHWHYLSSDDAWVSGVSGNIQRYTCGESWNHYSFYAFRLMYANGAKVKSGKYLAHFPVCEIFPRYFVMSEFNLTPKCHVSRIYIEF